MKNGLEVAYELVTEQAKEGLVKTNLKAGSPAMGDLKKDGNGAPKAKMKEADAKINPGHGKIRTESQELSDMLPQSKFDSLFKKQIIEEEDVELGGDESPLEMSGDNKFDDEAGDFPDDGGGDDVAEEVDVATELRLIIDRLNEVAEKLGSYDDGMDEAGEEVGEAGLEDAGEEGLSDEQLTPESVQAKLTALKSRVKVLQNGKNVVKSAFTVKKKKASAGGPGSGDASGKLSPARKTTLGPKMCQKAEVKGVMGKVSAGIFDGI